MILWKASWKIGFWRKCDEKFYDKCSVVEYNWTENDIIKEFQKYNDKKKVAKVYGLTVQQVTKILKRE